MRRDREATGVDIYKRYGGYERVFELHYKKMYHAQNRAGISAHLRVPGPLPLVRG